MCYSPIRFLSLHCSPKLATPAGIAAAMLYLVHDKLQDFVFFSFPQCSGSSCALYRLLSSHGPGARAGASSRAVQTRHGGSSGAAAMHPGKTGLLLKAISRNSDNN